MAEELTPEQVEAALANPELLNLNDTSDQEYSGGDIQPFPKGDYDFLIVEKPELRKYDGGSLGLHNMHLKVDVNGVDRHCWTNLVIHPNTIKNVKAFLFCIGERGRVLSATEVWSDAFAESLVGRGGRAHFDIDPNPGYKPKNVVKYWLNEFAKVRRNEAPDSTPAETLATPDGELPF